MTTTDDHGSDREGKDRDGKDRDGQRTDADGGSLIEKVKTNPAVSTALAVQTRYGDLNGGDVGSAITLSLFLSVFPLVLVAVIVLGFIADNDTQFIDDAISDMGLTGQAADLFTGLVQSAQNNKGALALVSFIGFLWSALGVSVAVQKAANLGWQAASLGIQDRVKALVFYLGGGALIASSIALTAAVRALPSWTSPLNIVVSLLLSVGIFGWLFWYLCSFRIPVKTVLPGAVLGALGFEVLKWLATNWLPDVIAKSSAVYGSLGVIFGTIAWLALLGKLLVYASILNVVLEERRSGTSTLNISVPKLADQWHAEATTRGGYVRKAKKPFKLPWKRA